MPGLTMLGKGPTQYFVTIRNDNAAGGANLTTGQSIEWKADGTRDGIDAVKTATAAFLSLFVGLIPEGHTINPQEYGLCQVYGYHGSADVYCHGTATNSNVAIGDIFSPSSGGPLTAVRAGATLTEQPPLVVALETLASSGTSTVASTCKVFIRAM